MKYYIKAFLIIVIGSILSCTNDDFEPKNYNEDRDNTDLANGTAQPGNVITPGQGVMMQAFYWDVIEGGIWWDNITSKIDNWAANGIDAIWIPPISKAQSGPFSMGYDPYDYFDFGEFEQKGTTETRFGSRAELENMIAKAHDNNVAVIADMVINHNSGGDLEYNEFRQLETYTSFRPASGLFNRSQYDFLPNANRLSDEGRFGGFPDVDLLSDYVQDWMFRSEQSIANYYMNTLGIDGWRFDYVKGYSPTIVKQWVETVGGFAVGESFDGNLDGVILPWIQASGVNAFDFPNFFNMKDAFNNGNLNDLTKPSLLASLPDKAVTFVGNHDTEARDGGNEFPNEWETHAYAYILSAPGYPTVFYSHYEDSGEEQKAKINQLIQLRSQLAAGDWEVKYVDNDEFIATRSGDVTKPGLALYINISDNEVSRDIQTHWVNANIKDYTEEFILFSQSDDMGNATLKAPAKGYAIWAYTEEDQQAFPDMVYVPGGYQGWNPSTASTLMAVETPNLLGTYIGYLSLPDQQNEFKITDNPNWDNGIYGDEGDGTSGILSSPGNNFKLAGPADYEIQIDIPNKTWSYITWGAIGSATPGGWDSDTNMMYNTDRNVWTLTTQLNDGEMKFRANDDWAINLGDNDADGSLEQDGSNINITAGGYIIDLDTKTNTYSLSNWGVIGSATPGGWDNDTNMDFDIDNNVWAITLDLVAGEMKFRLADDWAVNLGDNDANGSLEQDGSNIVIGQDGNYTIQMNTESSTYTITLN